MSMRYHSPDGALPRRPIHCLMIFAGHPVAVRVHGELHEPAEVLHEVRGDLAELVGGGPEQRAGAREVTLIERFPVRAERRERADPRRVQREADVDIAAGSHGDTTPPSGTRFHGVDDSVVCHGIALPNLTTRVRTMPDSP